LSAAHLALARLDRDGLFVATFAALVHSKSIMTEQTYLFGWCMCINDALTYLWTGSPWRLAEVLVALLVLALTRVQGAYVIAIVLPLLALGQSPKLHASMARSIQDAGKPINISALGISDSPGKDAVHGRLLRCVPSAGMDRGRSGKRPRIETPAKEPLVHGRRMFDEPGLLFHAGPADVGRPDELLQAIKQQPDGQYWCAIWNAFDEQLGAAASDALLLRVT
jgi:hypothetical protein